MFPGKSVGHARKRDGAKILSYEKHRRAVRPLAVPS